MNASLMSRFAELWHRLRATTDPTLVASDLLARWSEQHRRYHTLTHLESCLNLLDAHRVLAREVDALELALWFHDAVYDPRASDNEIQSARLATDALRAAGLPDVTLDNVERLILATRAHEHDGAPDTALLLDIDLSVLGSLPDTYQAYAQAIRREYAWVPEPDYRAKRAAVLTRFLERPRLFLTEPFLDRYETRARTNLGAEITSLATSPLLPRNEPFVNH